MVLKGTVDDPARTAGVLDFPGFYVMTMGLFGSRLCLALVVLNTCFGLQPLRSFCSAAEGVIDLTPEAMQPKPRSDL